MEIEYIGKIIVALMVIFVFVSIIFFIGDRGRDRNDSTEDFMKYGQLFASHSELCEQYDGTEISENEFKLIIATIAYSDCREMDIILEFSMTAKEFEQMVIDIFPKNKAPNIIYKATCEPVSVESGSYIVSTGFGEYLYRRGDNINIKVEGVMMRDVIICLER